MLGPLEVSYALAIVLGIFATMLTALVGRIRKKDHFPVNGRTVLITGGSQGMGRAVARQLSELGANVVIVARNVGKLKAAKEYIAAAAANANAQRFLDISADLKDAAESVRVLNEVRSWNNDQPPDIVWCIAGSAYPEFFLDMNIELLREGMDQNYWSAAYMAHATLKEWLRPTEPSKAPNPSQSIPSAPRHIIFTSSVIAFSSFVGYAQYAPAKAALRSLSDTLSQELKLYNGARRHKSQFGPLVDVKVHTVFPATIFSPGYEQEELTKPEITRKLEEDDKGQTEDEVAARSIKGLQKGQYLVTTNFLGSLMRGGAWCGSPRNNVLIDTLMSWITSVVWLFVQPSMDAKVTKWGEEHGHPTTYQRSTPT